jgi:hypothetical protein
LPLDFSEREAGIEFVLLEGPGERIAFRRERKHRAGIYTGLVFEEHSRVAGFAGGVDETESCVACA